MPTHKKVKLLSVVIFLCYIIVAAPQQQVPPEGSKCMLNWLAGLIQVNGLASAHEGVPVVLAKVSGKVLEVTKVEPSNPLPKIGKIAFASVRDGNFEVYIMDVDGKNQKRLTNNRAIDGGPVFSPDGRKIAFLSSRDGNLEIYIMDVDGKNQKRLTYNRAFDGFPAFSPF